MSKVRKRKLYGTVVFTDNHNKQDQGIRVHQGLYRLALFFFTRYSLRLVRDGKRKTYIHYYNQNNTRMSKLRKSILKILQEVGDRSGCHQLPERSFTIKSYTFPVCARCTGVFIGQVLAIIAFLFGLRNNPFLSVGLLAIMGCDWLIQQIGLRASTNMRRLFTGICGGFGLFSIYLFGLIQIYTLFKA